jgi:hypothetical protein
MRLFTPNATLCEIWSTFEMYVSFSLFSCRQLTDDDSNGFLASKTPIFYHKIVAQIF